MRDRNAYENSSVWNMVSEIKQDEYINSLSPGMRNYLMYLLYKKRLKKLIVRRKYYLSKSKRDQAVLVDGSSLIHMGNMQGIKRLQHLYTTFLPLLFQ